MSDTAGGLKEVSTDERDPGTALTTGQNVRQTQTSTAHIFFDDVTLTHHLPSPSAIMPNRFKLTAGPTGEVTFAYRGRESFRPLVNKVLSLLNKEMIPSTTIRYIGNVGLGKSHNLAALAHYLRKLKAGQGHEFHHDVIYISSCELLFKHSPLKNLKTVLCEAFPNDRETVEACSEWKDLVKHIHTKPKWSILFINDDWNYVLSEKKLGQMTESSRNEHQLMLLELSYGQYSIEAISSGSECLTTKSNAERAPADTVFLHLFGGLTDNEWAAWKGTEGSQFSGLRDEMIDAMVVDFTGLVPLYLRTLEELEKGDVRERVNKFSSTELGCTINEHLQETSGTFLTAAAKSDRDIFLRQMMNALSEVPAPLLNHRFYDHRYFYFDDDSEVLRPVSGFVRHLMRNILEEQATDQFREQVTLAWVLSAFNHGYPSVQGFAFEEYCLLQILRCPSQYLKDVPEGTTCTLERFDGEFPEEGKLNKDGLTLFWPKKFNLAYVDAVVRYVHPQVMAAPSTTKKRPSRNKQPPAGPENIVIDIIGVQVTIQEPRDHGNSLTFFANFSEPNKYCNFLKFLRRGERLGSVPVTVTKQLAWIVPLVPLVPLLLPSDISDEYEYPPSDDCTQFVTKVSVV